MGNFYEQFVIMTDIEYMSSIKIYRIDTLNRENQLI